MRHLTPKLQQLSDWIHRREVKHLSELAQLKEYGQAVQRELGKLHPISGQIQKALDRLEKGNVHISGRDQFHAGIVKELRAAANSYAKLSDPETQRLAEMYPSMANLGPEGRNLTGKELHEYRQQVAAEERQEEAYERLRRGEGDDLDRRIVDPNSFENRSRNIAVMPDPGAAPEGSSLVTSGISGE